MPSSSIWTKELQVHWARSYPDAPLPRFCIENPGRVNLIGEHVDHQAYPVCPCAIQQAMRAAVSIEPKTESNFYVEVANVDPTFPRYRFQSIDDLVIRADKQWTNYVVAAYFGLVEYWINGCRAEEVGKMIDPKIGLTAEMIAESRLKPQSPINYCIRILFDGNVPIAAGLSSSSALVVSCTLAFAVAGGQAPKFRTLAELSARSERYSGVASGGMDQAAILLSQEGSCLFIKFKPLEVDCVQLPAGSALVIANSCRLSPKAKLAAKMYNKRVFELKAGCLALLPEHTAKAITTEQLLVLQLRDVVRDYLKTSEKELMQILPYVIKKHGAWTKDEMTAIFGEERRDALLTRCCGSDVWRMNDSFDVFKRVRHVLSEAQRVVDFVSVCRNSNLSDEAKLRELGALMNAAGESMSVDFDASCPEVEELIAIAKESGAYGARVTGAGWGGCIVALVKTSEVERVINELRKRYYEPLVTGARSMEPKLEALPKTIEGISECVFSTQPSRGAFVEYVD